jgi:glycosyltransferase involved in cell wall biosynthesis
MSRKVEGGLRTQGSFKESYDDQPLISIITVVYNGDKYLEETIKSVINQTYDNVEYIIIDGGSNDGTLDIIKRYDDQIDYWLSEKDNGIYYAMNKGLTLISGDWVNLMNSGDEFYNNETLSDINFDKISTCIIFGKAYIYYKDQNFIRSSDFHLGKGKKTPPNHQAVFVSKKIYKTILYDTTYKYSADSVYLKKIFSKFSFQEVDMIINKFELGGVSNFYGTYKVFKGITYDHIKMSGTIIKPIMVNSVKFFLQKVMGIDSYLKFFIKYIVKK